MNIEEKIRKIRSIMNDKAACKGEKEAASLLLEKLQAKYDVTLEEDDTEQKQWFNIKCSNDFERSVLLRVLESYKLKAHLKKKHSKNLILFYTSASYFDLISAELNYHYSVLLKYLKSVTVNYVHKFILPYKIPENKTNSRDKLTDEAAEAASMIFAGKNYTAKKMIEQ